MVKKINSATGTPILMVEQNAKQALGIAGRGYVLVDGKNRFEGTGAGPARRFAEVAEMFLGGGKQSEEPATKPRKPAAKKQPRKSRKT